MQHETTFNHEATANSRATAAQGAPAVPGATTTPRAAAPPAAMAIPGVMANPGATAVPETMIVPETTVRTNRTAGGVTAARHVPPMEQETSPARDTTAFVVYSDEPTRTLVEALTRDMEVRVKTFASAEAFLDAFNDGMPGVLLINDRAPTRRSIQLLRELAERDVAIPTLVVTERVNTRTAIEVIKAGAYDVIERPIEASLLLRAVRNALRADAERHRAVAGRMAIVDRWRSLTPREQEIAVRVVRGMANRQVARELGLSERTVEVYRSRVQHKMQAGNLADLVRQTVTAQLV